MTNKSKQKGTVWETRVGKYLGLRRLPLAGSKDIGDLDCDIAVVECKNTQTFNLAGWMDELEVEKTNAGKNFGFVIFPRKNHVTSKGYALMSIEQLVVILAILETHYV